MLLFAYEYYQNAVSGDVIRFFRKGSEYWMEWKGTGWEKLGTWSVIRHEGKNFLEFRYNYAREETYAFTIIETLASQSEEITAFRLKDSLNRYWDFRKAAR